jgi:serpin B
MTHFGWLAVVAPAVLFACSGTSPGEQETSQGGAGPVGQGGAGGTTPAPLPDVAKSALTYDSAPSVDPATEAALVNDLNSFGLQALQRLAPSDQNFVVSPVSGFVALTMTSAGAQGTTADEMKAVLYPTVSLSEIHPATNRLEQRIRGYARSAVETSYGEKKVELHLANEDFVQQGFPIEQPFLDTLAVNYDCGVELVDYQSDPNAASALINNWVAKETNDRITNLLQPGVVDTSTRLVLVNALYLYSSWLTAFDPNSTHARTFHGIDGDSSTDFMNAVLNPSYATGAGWVGVDVPYYGDSLVLTAVLPDAGEFDTVKSSLDAAFFASFDAASQPQQLALSMPKFTLAGQTVSWKEALQALGMTTLFEPATANLEGISALRPLYAKDVVQQVFVEVAEKGTEAAAATAVVIGTDGGAVMPPPLQVVLDRPFLFFIRERGGPVLFAGQIVNLPVN